MAFRLYITPQIGDGSDNNSRRPKYFTGVSFAAMDYGFQPIFLVAADLTAPQDAAIIANADVTPFPFNLDVAIGGGNVQAARNALEAALIPAQWANGQMMWREVARIVAGMFQFMQRLNYYLGNEILFTDTTKLNMQWSAVPVEPYQTAITQAATSLGYPFAPQANDQMRVILKDLSDQWGNKPFILGGFIF